MNHLRSRWPIFFLAFAPLLPLWRAIFLGEAIGPWNQIRAMAPWNGSVPNQPWDVLQADGVLQFAPWRFLVFQSWSKGQLPFWNSYQLMGTPLLANSQSGALYPLHILMGVLHMPLFAAITFLAWFHLFWAGLGVYLLTRRMGGMKAGAAIAGASFSLSAFMVSWTALPSVITTVSWIPWILASILAAFQCDPFWRIGDRVQSLPLGDPKKALREALLSMNARSGWLALLCVSVAMMILAGHLQFVAFGLLAAVLLVISLVVSNSMSVSSVHSIKNKMTQTGRVKISEGRRPRFFPAAALGCMFAILVGGLIASPQLLPVLKFSKQSHRRSAPTSAGYTAYTASAIQPFEWMDLEFPKVLGDPSEYADNMGHSQYWPMYAKPGANFAESALAIGPLVLLLLCFLSSATWKRAIPIVLVGLLGVLIAFGTPFDYLLYYGIPGWSSTGSPGRAIVLFVLAACCLAGLAIQPQKGRDPKDVARLRKAFIRFAVISAVLALLSVVGLSTIQPFTPALGDLAPIVSAARANAAPVALITILLVVASGAAWRRRGPSAKAGLLATALLTPFLLTYGVLRTATPIQPIASSTTERVAFVNSNWNLFGIPHAQMPPNMASFMGVHDLAGYDSLLDKDTKALLDQANGQDSSPPENGNMLLVKGSVKPESLAALGVTTLNYRDSNGMPQAMHIDGPGRVSVDNGSSATIESESFNSIGVRANGPGLLTLRDRNMEGWTAIVNGQPTPIKPGPFMSLDLPAAMCDVHFTYSPPGFSEGVTACIVGLILLASMLYRWRKGISVPIP
jgi:hypothetical protein